MSSIGRLIIDPPLMNSSSPWASSLRDIEELYDCPFTGGVTTRTATLNGFQEDPAIHQVNTSRFDHISNENSIEK